MAVLKKKLTAEHIVKGYFYIQEDIKAISSLAESANTDVRESAKKGLADIKASIPKFEKEIAKTRKIAETELDSHEDEFVGRMDEEQYQAEFEAYEQDIIMMDFVAQDAKKLYDLVEDCEKKLAGEKVEERKVEGVEPQNYEEYVEYTKQAIALARKKQLAEAKTSAKISTEGLSNAGMIAAATVAASNPVLGSTLMVANWVAKNRKQNGQNDIEKQSQPGNE